MYGIIQFEQHVPYMVFLSVTSDRKVQCPRVGLGVKIYDTPAEGICASQGLFSSFLPFYLCISAKVNDKIYAKIAAIYCIKVLFLTYINTK